MERTAEVRERNGNETRTRGGKRDNGMIRHEHERETTNRSKRRQCR